ncbi:MAG: hypothetical protein K2K55_03535 [Duncaniella sp.]|nr:hypothetical protein [Duncaniella sp.]
MELNTKLLRLYNSKLSDLNNLFGHLLSSKNDADKDFSWPLLLRIWEEDYVTAPIKLMIFGKETNGWNNQTESNIEKNTAETLTEEYVLHNMGRNRTRSQFWNTIRQLNAMLGNPDTNCFVWNNILKFGKEDDSGAPSDGVIKAELEYFNVIPDEVSILDPEVCIFLTGPDYDTDISNKFPDSEFITIEGFETNQLVKIKSAGLPEKTFRTYHPRYRTYNKELYDEILHKIVELSK